MKHAVLVLVLSSSLTACLGEVDGGGLSGATDTSAPSGSAGSVSLTGAAGTNGVVATGGAGSTGTAGTASVTGAGTGVAGTNGGGAGVGAGSAGAGASTCSASGIPADVAAVISGTCIACHGTTPIQGVPSSMTTYAQLTAPSTTQPGRSVAAVALERLQGGAMPMPPPPLSRATPAQIAAFQSWVSAGTPRATCPDGGVPADGGAIGDGGAIVDPFAAPPVCTSKTMWTRNNSGSDQMNPGLACINCHTSMKKGPTLAIAGTIFPTAHEPDLCNGGSVTAGARIVITGANGQSVTLTPNNAGNFRYQGTIAKPYTAKVTYMGRERAMLEPQTSGDCNTCHTQMGMMKAPGRIILP